ncbi:MAG: cytochrome C [Rhodobacterales bacterium 32-67-9]|nr:MAG: cytochrome C [Rhodobacterales bacterium 32-67-9]
MRGLIRFSFVLPTGVAGFGAGILALWPIGEAEPSSFPQGDVERGAYLARASGCVSCHTDASRRGPALAGGAPLDTPFGTFVPPNITPHPDAGIGRWTVADFARAVRQGVSPEGRPYYPVFAYSFYAGFSDQDIADLWEAFRTVPPVADADAPHDIGFPFSFRSGLKLWRATYLEAPVTEAYMGTSSPWNRGRLLVEGAAHCAACHTGRNLVGGLKTSARFTGNDDLPGGSKAPSIQSTALVERGFTVSNLAYALRTGLLPNGDAFGGSMAEVVADGTSYLTDADRQAIATYLLDPEGTGSIPTPQPLAAETPMAGMDHSQMDMSNDK